MRQPREHAAGPRVGPPSRVGRAFGARRIRRVARPAVGRRVADYRRVRRHPRRRARLCRRSDDCRHPARHAPARERNTTQLASACLRDGRHVAHRAHPLARRRVAGASARPGRMAERRATRPDVRRVHRALASRTRRRPACRVGGAADRRRPARSEPGVVAPSGPGIPARSNTHHRSVDSRSARAPDAGSARIRRPVEPAEAGAAQPAPDREAAHDARRRRVGRGEPVSAARRARRLMGAFHRARHQSLPHDAGPVPSLQRRRAHRLRRFSGRQRRILPGDGHSARSRPPVRRSRWRRRSAGRVDQRVGSRARDGRRGTRSGNRSNTAAWMAISASSPSSASSAT